MDKGKDGLEMLKTIGPQTVSPPQKACRSQEKTAPLSLPSLDQTFVEGFVETAAGRVPKVSTSLNWVDRLGSIKARWGVGRMHFKVDPGLYALGEPDEETRVFVTANYKMSFDRLREALANRSALILVLDTIGINVWCAAGKGTFGTEELLRRMESSRLERIVAHRELILPQLSGPGVAAHLVKKRSGFKVIYGPIASTDLGRFLDAGCRATARMRKKTFSTRERTVLVPVELAGTLKWSLIVLPGLFFLGGFGGEDGFWAGTMRYGLFAAIAFLCAILSGAVMTPILLPWLPGRAFSLKGDDYGTGNGLCACCCLVSGVQGRDGNYGMVFLDSRSFRISGHELHRGFHLHLAFRGPQRDEVGRSP